MAINFNKDNSGLINLSRNIDTNQMAFLPDFFTNMFSGNPEDIQLGEEGSPIDKTKDFLEKNKQKSLPSPEDVLKGNVSSLNLPSNNLTAMAISNYDNLFGPQTVTDAFGVNRSTLGFARPDINTSPFNVNEVTSDGITNNVRFRDMLFNDLRNLPSDLRTSLGTTKDALTKDVSGLTNFLTNVKDKGIDMLGSGKDIALRGIGSIIGGPVGGFIGSLIGGIKESPTDKVGLASFGGDYDPYGFKGQLTSGTLGARQDPFGRNIVSFGDYYGNRLAEVAKLSKLQNLNKFQKAKLDFGKKYLEKVKEERAKKEAAQRAEFNRLNEIRKQRDRSSMSGGVGETLGGTFGSSVNDPGSFSDYS